MTTAVDGLRWTAIGLENRLQVLDWIQQGLFATEHGRRQLDAWRQQAVAIPLGERLEVDIRLINAVSPPAEGYGDWRGVVAWSTIAAAIIIVALLVWLWRRRRPPVAAAPLPAWYDE